MSQHPANLGLRFILEMAALGAMGYWGWSQVNGSARYLLAFGVPILAAVVWAVFRVPGDPGSAPVAIPGVLRLILEAAFFGFAVWGLSASNARPAAWTLLALVVIHYAASADRLGKLLQH